MIRTKQQHLHLQQQQHTMSFPESHSDNNNNMMTTDSSRKSSWIQSVARRTVSFVQNDIQQVVSQSPFLQQASTCASASSTDVALFHRSEIITGKRLGKGGFSNVYEITALELNHDFVSTRLTPQQCQLRLQFQRTIATSGGQRYVIKQLQEKLLSNPKQFQVAASDLAVEAAYMTSLDHANILKARGLPVDGIEALADGHHDGYFVILDRLQGTLDQCIEQWKLGQDASVMEKADFALQLARAVAYLHERRIIFRDIKAANVGFTADGTIKLLDFGLCRQLPANQPYYNSNKNLEEECFEMSGVGTRRYMAVEIIKTSKYNEKADVYSWSMLLWEMLSLQKPFETYSVEEHRVLVCEQGQRPPLQVNGNNNNSSKCMLPLPTSIQHLLQQTWCESIPQRLSMQQAHNVLQGILNTSFCVLRQEAPPSPVGVCDASYMMMMEQQEEPYHKQMLLLPTMAHHLQLPFVSTTTYDDDDDLDLDHHDDVERDFLQDHRMSSVTLHDLYEQESASDICSLLLDDDSLLGGTDDHDMLLLAACPNNAPYHHHDHNPNQHQHHQQQQHYHDHDDTNPSYYDYDVQYNNTPRLDYFCSKTACCISATFPY
jgi:serine/threonine protein kinase